MKSSKNLYIIGAVIVVLLIGGYVVFQGKTGAALPVADVPFVPSATTTPNIPSGPAYETSNDTGSRYYSGRRRKNLV